MGGRSVAILLNLVWHLILATFRVTKSKLPHISLFTLMNKCMQKQQMDIQLRYRCCASNRVKVRYWDSKFQLSMDEPNVNCSIFSKLQKQREEEELPPLEDVGSCELHMISGAFENGVKSASWDMEKVLRSMWKLADLSPAHRDDFIKVCTTSPPFPVKLKPVSKCPQKNISSHKDTQMLNDIAAKFKGFLTTFQSDALEKITQCFMTDSLMLIKNDVEDAAKYKLLSQVKLLKLCYHQVSFLTSKRNLCRRGLRH